jgi:hypothetical protein
MARNLWAKTRPISNPYATVTVGDWTYSILKAYSRRSKEKLDKYARWLCLVVTPFTGSGGDIGDTYITSVPMTPELHRILEDRETLEEEVV